MRRAFRAPVLAVLALAIAACAVPRGASPRLQTMHAEEHPSIQVRVPAPQIHQAQSWLRELESLERANEAELERLLTPRLLAPR